MTKTKEEIEGLVRLFLADGLPPNITVHTIRVREDWESHLVIDENDYSMHPERPEPTEEEAKAMSLQKEEVQLQEFNIEGQRILAGFSQPGYSLIIGQWNGDRPLPP